MKKKSLKQRAQYTYNPLKDIEKDLLIMTPFPLDWSKKTFAAMKKPKP